jgi:hypothetical protein
MKLSGGIGVLESIALTAWTGATCKPLPIDSSRENQAFLVAYGEGRKLVNRGRHLSARETADKVISQCCNRCERVSVSSGKAAM